MVILARILTLLSPLLALKIIFREKAEESAYHLTQLYKNINNLVRGPPATQMILSAGINRRIEMNKTLTALALTGTLLLSQTAMAAGCIKGAVAGGVAGHMAHHHGVIGAVGGCIVGHHMAKKAAEKKAAEAKQQQSH